MSKCHPPGSGAQYSQKARLVLVWRERAPPGFGSDTDILRTVSKRFSDISSRCAALGLIQTTHNGFLAVLGSASWGIPLTHPFHSNPVTPP